MFKTLGTNWALTLVAFLSLILMPVRPLPTSLSPATDPSSQIPFFFLKYGARIRAKSTFAPSHGPVKMSDPLTTRELDLAEEVAEGDLRRREDEETEKRFELAAVKA